ncbi:MAG: chloroperoxidase [Oligoflexus sp.]
MLRNVVFVSYLFGLAFFVEACSRNSPDDRHEHVPDHSEVHVPELETVLQFPSAPPQEEPEEPTTHYIASSEPDALAIQAYEAIHDPILEWNAIALEADVTSHTMERGDQLGPTRASRALAIVHLAMYDAYNAIEPVGEPYLFVKAPANANTDVAASVAAYVTLRYLYPSQSRTLDQAIRKTLLRYPYTAVEYNSILFGKYVGLRMLWNRFRDGSEIMGTYDVVNRPGFHAPDPLNPNQGFLDPAWGHVRPFAIPNTRLFTAPPPPALDSRTYINAFEEVRRLGGDGIVTPTVRSREQTLIGLFWAYDGTPKLGTPPRLYNQIVRTIAQQKNNKIGENARLFALVNMAMADAAIQSWSDKYRYNFWRPVIGIRHGHVADVSQSEGDPNWTPLGAPASNTRQPNFTPPFPTYTSGHATIGTAAMHMIRKFYGTDQIPFSFISDELNGKTRGNDGRVRPLIERSFRTISEAIAENADSRIFLGIHWRFDQVEGVRSGRRIADYIADKQLRTR